jgi:hypothetical protein
MAAIDNAQGNCVVLKSRKNFTYAVSLHPGAAKATKLGDTDPAPSAYIDI